MHPVQREIFRKMSPEEKLRISWQLYWDARKLKAAWLKKIHPDWSEEQVAEEVRRIFLYAHT